MSHNSAAQLLSNAVFWNSKNIAFPFEVPVAKLLERSELAIPRIVDDYVQAAKGIESGPHRSLSLLLIRYILLHGSNLATILVHQIPLRPKMLAKDRLAPHPLTMAIKSSERSIT
jgi:hypothetical protein